MSSLTGNDSNFPSIFGCVQEITPLKRQEAVQNESAETKQEPTAQKDSENKKKSFDEVMKSEPTAEDDKSKADAKLLLVLDPENKDAPASKSSDS
jgi:hypothetical protein